MLEYANKISDRFWRKVNKITDSTSCWEWTAEKHNGYGIIKYYPPGLSQSQKISFTASRVAWMITNQQSTPEGMIICHKCDNPSCVRPDHLFLGTRRDNVIDCIAKGRNKVNSLKGELHGNAKLSNIQVVEMVEKYKTGKYTKKELSVMYSVSPTTISEIMNGVTWRSITGGKIER